MSAQSPHLSSPLVGGTKVYNVIVSTEPSDCRCHQVSPYTGVRYFSNRTLFALIIRCIQTRPGAAIFKKTPTGRSSGDERERLLFAVEWCVLFRHYFEEVATLTSWRPAITVTVFLRSTICVSKLSRRWTYTHELENFAQRFVCSSPLCWQFAATDAGACNINNVLHAQ